jgi:hypothetical protein
MGSLARSKANPESKSGLPRGQVRRHYDAQLHSRSGQAVAFDKITLIDVVKIHAEHADIRIALVDDKVINTSLGAPAPSTGSAAKTS